MADNVAGLGYIARNSPIHRLTGASKLLMVVLVSVAAMITYDTRFLVAVILLSCTLFAMSRVKLRELRTIVLLIGAFMLMNNLFIFLFAPEEGVKIYGTRQVLLPLFGRYVLTREQLFYQLNVTIKYFSIMPIALIFFVTTEPSEFASSLNRIGVSYKIGYSVALALRYIPDIRREYQEISQAQQARGIDLSKNAKLTQRVKGATAILFPLIFSSLDRIETIANAMELRSFGKHKQRTWYRARPFAKADYVVIVGSTLLVVIAIALNIVNGGRFYNPFRERIEIQQVYVTDAPVNPNATREAVLLKEYLNQSYGNVVLSGQYADGVDAPEIHAIYGETGKYPAMMGFDLIYSGTTASANEAKGDQAIAWATDWGMRGGIVTFCWHWLAPAGNHLSAEYPWNKSFYAQGTSFDLQKALSGEDAAGYALLLEDIDAASMALKTLQEAGVPVLWRPLHEASGGWFWWGSAGAEAYKALWNLMYDRMVNVHGLNNLIWVWNGQHNDTDALRAWYPGDDTVDIIGEDIYPDRQDYASHVERFDEAQAYTDANKIVALTETGVIPDPDLLSKDGAMWAWFAPWYREYVVDMSAGYENGLYSGEYTSAEMLRKVYTHELVITLDELPWFEE